MKRKQIVISLFLCMLLAGALALECVAKTKTWYIFEYEIVAQEIAGFGSFLMKMALACVIGVTLPLGLRFFETNRRTACGVCLVLPVVALAAYGCMNSSGITGFWYALRFLFLACFVPICYGFLWILPGFIGRQAARILYLGFGVATVLLSNWSFDYGCISLNPVKILWMSAGFVMVYGSCFWDSRTSRWLQAAQQVCLTAIMTVLLSYPRLEYIVETFEFEETENFMKTNWLLYRINTVQAFVTGRFGSDRLDPLVLLRVRDYTMSWLRTAFDGRLALLYFLIFVAFLAAVAAMLGQKGLRPLTRLTGCGILISNILGLISEIFLFRESEIGILMSVNIFQIVPVLCFVILSLTDLSPSGADADPLLFTE